MIKALTVCLALIEAFIVCLALIVFRLLKAFTKLLIKALMRVFIVLIPSIHLLNMRKTLIRLCILFPTIAVPLAILVRWTIPRTLARQILLATSTTMIMAMSVRIQCQRGWLNFFTCFQSWYRMCMVSVLCIG